MSFERGFSRKRFWTKRQIIENGWFFCVIIWQSIVQDHIQQGLMDQDATVVLDKTEFAKAIHEEADAGPRGADHLRKRLLGDWRN